MDSIQRIVIIGGPGSGKSSIVNQLDAAGHRVHHEISRQVIREAQQQGIDQLFLSDPFTFSNRLLNERIRQYQQASVGLNFYDRGIPDVPAYHIFKDETIPDSYIKASKEHRYDAVFFLPPWSAIYKTDNERYETFEQAQQVSEILIDFYTSLNYHPIVVPQLPINERIVFIMNQLAGD